MGIKSLGFLNTEWPHFLLALWLKMSYNSSTNITLRYLLF
jgi:hypothetical protein